MGYEGLRAPWPWSIAPNFRNKPLICLYLHKQKSKVKGSVVHRLLAVAFPPEEEEMGHPAAGREERRRRPMASAGCPPRRSLVRRLSLSSPPFYSFVVGAYLCVVSLARWVFDGSPQPKKEKKNFLIAYVMRPIVGLVDANSLRPKQTNLVWDVTVLGLFSKCCYVCPLVKHVVRSWWVWHITIRTFRL